MEATLFYVTLVPYMSIKRSAKSVKSLTSDVHVVRYYFVAAALAAITRATLWGVLMQFLSALAPSRAGLKSQISDFSGRSDTLFPAVSKSLNDFYAVSMGSVA